MQLTPLAAQAPQPQRKAMHVAKAEYFAESLPARELAAIGIAQNRKRLSTDPFFEEKNASNKRHIRKYPADAPITPDGALWSAPPGLLPLAPPNAPTVGFNGISKADTVAIGQGFLPPDTTGAVGPNHFVQSVNSAWAVWDRSGAPLIATTALSSLFSALPGPCATANDGDPIVVYDQLADRFLISQFCYSVDSTPNHQVIAVSKTGDPTGAYYLYDFRMPNLKFNDYPKFGVWPDGYYMTDNQFNQAGGAFLAAGAFAFDRSKMLAGDPTASYVYFDMEALFPSDGIGGMLPASVDGFTPPPAGAPAPFVYFTAGEFGDAAGDALRIFDFHVDFAVPANSTFGERTGSPLAVAAFDPRVVPNTRNVIPQPAPATSSHFLDALNDRLMFRLAYRNFGSSESLVLNHTVNAAVNPAYRAGVRVYQLSRATPTGAFTIAEQATWAGSDTTTHRWLGSVAMNHQGDLALGYSVSSTAVIPSIRYVAKLAAQSLATGLAQGETEIKTGGGVPQTSASGRWGDYSQMTVDPVDDCTFWYTQEYYATGGTGTSPWRTWIAKFAPGACVTSPRGTISGTITACAGGAPIANALVSTTGGYSRSTISAGTYGMTVIPGSYTVTVRAAGYASATSGSLSVSNGGTTTYNTCLNTAPVIQATTPVTISAENAIPANTLADPDETLTVGFPLRNIGLANTTNLVATLQATGGVTSPGAAQNYGVVVAGGSSVSQNFSFTATGACGAIVTPTLALQDGATNLGTISYAMQLGASGSSILFSQFFDTVTAPALPAGWTSAGGGGLVAWVTSTTSPSSAPNTAFVAGAGSTGNSELISPAFAVGSDGGKVSFRNLYNLEDGFDGMVLEISINGGAYVDIITAGGKVIAGGYNDIISSADGSGIAGRPAWTGVSGGGASAAYITTTITLPATAAGQSIRLKWRVVTDSTVTPSGSGVRIDNIDVTRNDCSTLRPLDVDLTGTYQGPTDGMMLLRYLLGLPIAAVTGNSVNTATGQRTNPAQILIHLDKIRPLLDIDGNGQADALTDGLMILRYMLGFRDAAVTQNAVAVSPPPTRNTGQINTRLQALTPP